VLAAAVLSGKPDARERTPTPHISQAGWVANTVFSICAALAALAVSILSAAKGAWIVALVFGLLVVGFLLRAREGRREAARDRAARR